MMVLCTEMYRPIYTNTSCRCWFLLFLSELRFAAMHVFTMSKNWSFGSCMQVEDYLQYEAREVKLIKKVSKRINYVEQEEYAFVLDELLTLTDY